MSSASDIARTILEIGQISGLGLQNAAAARAQGISQSADAQARAQANSGQIWGQAISQLGQIPGQVYQQYQQNKQQAADLQLKQLTVDRAKQVNDGQQAASALLSSLSKNQDGTYNTDSLTSSPGWAKLNLDQQREFLSTVDAVNQHASAINTTRIDHAAGLADTALKQAEKTGHPMTPQDASMWLTAAQDVGAGTPEEVQQIRAAIIKGADPTQVFQIVRGQSKKFASEKPVVVGQGGSLVDPTTGKPIYTAPSRPVEVARGGTLVDPTTGNTIATGQPIEPAPKGLQTKSVLIDGKPAEATFDPSTGEWRQGQTPIDSSRVKPIPPASVQVNNANAAAAANTPDWTRDASRPTGPDGNKQDKALGLTPNAVYQGALTFIQNGQMPNFGMSRDPKVQAKRDAIQNKAGAIAADAGMDIPTLRAFYKANQASLTATQKSSDAVQQFMATADKNSEQLQKLLDRVPDVGSPVLNTPWRAFQGSVVGNANLSAFRTYLQSVRNEYGRIVSQPNLSGVLSDSARQETSALLNDNATVGQMLASLQALRTEGDNRVLSLGEQIQKITGRMGIGNQGTGSAPPVQPPTGRFNPATGKVE